MAFLTFRTYAAQIWDVSSGDEVRVVWTQDAPKALTWGAVMGWACVGIFRVCGLNACVFLPEPCNTPLERGTLPVQHKVFSRYALSVHLTPRFQLPALLTRTCYVIATNRSECFATLEAARLHVCTLKNRNNFNNNVFVAFSALCPQTHAWGGIGFFQLMKIAESMLIGIDTSAWVQRLLGITASFCVEVEHGAERATQIMKKASRERICRESDMQNWIEIAARCWLSGGNVRKIHSKGLVDMVEQDWRFCLPGPQSSAEIPPEWRVCKQAAVGCVMKGSPIDKATVFKCMLNTHTFNQIRLLALGTVCRYYCTHRIGSEAWKFVHSEACWMGKLIWFTPLPEFLHLLSTGTSAPAPRTRTRLWYLPLIWRDPFAEDNYRSHALWSVYEATCLL